MTPDLYTLGVLDRHLHISPCCWNLLLNRYRSFQLLRMEGVGSLWWNSTFYRVCVRVLLYFFTTHILTKSIIIFYSSLDSVGSCSFNCLCNSLSVSILLYKMSTILLTYTYHYIYLEFLYLTFFVQWNTMYVIICLKCL